MAHPREYTLALVAYVQVRLLALSDFRYDGKTPESGVSFLFIMFCFFTKTYKKLKFSHSLLKLSFFCYTIFIVESE